MKNTDINGDPFDLKLFGSKIYSKEQNDKRNLSINFRPCVPVERSTNSKGDGVICEARNGLLNKLE
jgi:hypothetical protein